ncbi:GIY-YIG nuclease family protein [Gemmata palustris]|uniref:GIY-YIG nuclease family protein n=1 Tax=Gemmata palustris TaxID=2822762 RepID=UPI0036F20ECE
MTGTKNVPLRARSRRRIPSPLRAEQHRVDESGDASFSFDMHVTIKCDDAPALESALHYALRSRRVNRLCVLYPAAT